MKKSIKILLITTITLVVILIAVVFAISPFAKYYIEKNSKELTGRQINLDKLRFNIFNGKLRIDNIRMMEVNDTATFFSMDEVYVDMRLWPLIKSQISVQEVIITKPNMNVYQNGPHFNFDDLLTRFLSDTTAVDAADSTMSWEVGIDNIELKQGHIYYEDLQIGATWGMNDLDATIPGIYFKDKTDVGVLFNFARGGSIALKLNYDMDNSDYKLEIALDKMTLNGRLPYLQQTLNARNVDGLLSAKLNVNGNIDRLMDIYLDGSIDLSKFSLEDMKGAQVVKVDSLHVGLTKGSLRHNQFHFSRLYLLGMEGKLELYKNGTTNIDALMKQSPTTIQSSATDTVTYEPLDLRIEDLEIARGAVVLRDLTHLKPFEYRLSNIRMKSSFDMNSPNKIVVDAQIQKTGRAQIRWEGKATGLDNHNLLLTLTNIDIRDFSPYCEHYTAYPLINGNLSFRSHNIIRNRQLIGTNHLDMFEPAADKKIKEITPEFNVPLKLGLYVMKDRTGHVKIDLPVKGSIDNPDFSYRKIIFKALGNVLLKVITAPFSFLSGGDNLEYINIDPLQSDFSSEQYSKLDKLADMLRDKPDMKITLTQRINHSKAIHSLEQGNLKVAYYNHLRKADTTVAYTPLTMIDLDKIQDMNFKSGAVMHFADSLIRLQGGDPAKLHAADKAATLYSTQAQQQLVKILERRNASAMQYMTEMQSIPATALHIATINAEEMKSYKGKDRYTIAVEVEGETAEVSSHPDDVNSTRKAMGLKPEKHTSTPAPKV